MTGFVFAGVMKATLLIDDGYLLAAAISAGKTYDATFASKFSHSRVAAGNREGGTL